MVAGERHVVARLVAAGVANATSAPKLPMPYEGAGEDEQQPPAMMAQLDALFSGPAAGSP